jgi:crotonobetainyl-CoA:carnitine CoA-transferase CaiB-like acyl-CoA transferase
MKPLEGLRILDLTRLLPGPLATRHLLELGAEVLKIEGPEGEDQDDGTRAMWQTPDEVARGAPGPFFRELNDGKRLLRIDLRSDSGREALIDLVRAADALIEGFRPGVMARLGLGYERLSQVNPRLVMCAISGYGQHGPWSQRAGHDINYLAMAGVLEQIAGPDGRPGLPNFQIADLLGGTLSAVNGVLAALLGAARSGRGAFVDVSMTHEVWRHAVVARTALAALGKVAPPGRDLLSGGVPCYGVYRTRDGRFLAFGALEPKFWRGVCEVVGRPEWVKKHHAFGLEVGGDAAMALRDELASLIATRTLAQWMPAFDAADCCVTPVLRLDESRAHPLFA